MPIREVKLAFCLNCRREMRPERIPGAAPGPGSTTTPEYLCGQCGWRAVIFYINESAYLGFGNLSEISALPGSPATIASPSAP